MISPAISSNAFFKKPGDEIITLNPNLGVQAKTPSPNGTKITTPHDSPIIDQARNSWTLVPAAAGGMQIAANGTVDPTTANVVLLETLEGKIVQENTAGNWYSKLNLGGVWTQIPMPVALPPSVTTGSGSDALILSVSEDAYQGDAQFTVSVDGKQLNGTFTVIAPHATAASQSFIFNGDWATGTHAVTVNFLNDAYGGTAATDRNLYVNAIRYDGTDTGQAAALMGPGPETFNVMDSTAVPSAAIGTGPDTLVLSVSEDAYQGDAQFSVSVDGKVLGGGKQFGGIFTATASHTKGTSQNFTFKGDFGPGQHAVVVTFVNDAWGGTPATDRNLYVDAISYEGIDTGQSAMLAAYGPATFMVSRGATPSVAAYSPTTSAGSGGTTSSVTETGDHGILTLNLSQTGTFAVGADTFVIATGNTTSVTLGTGVSKIKFLGASSITFTGGSGQAIVTADTGSNKFIAGAGTLDVMGGRGSDAYIFPTNGGLLRIEDFSVAKGDTLTVDKALRGALQEASDGQGGTMLTFGTGINHGVDIHGIAAIPATSIAWA